MSQIRDIQSELSHELNCFLDSWEEARVMWKDDVASQFAKRFVSPWESEMPGFLVSLEALEQELLDARRELR